MRNGGCCRNCRVATARVRTRRHTTLLSGRGTSQVGSARPQSHWKARRTAYLDATDYKPMFSSFVEILSRFLRAGGKYSRALEYPTDNGKCGHTLPIAYAELSGQRPQCPLEHARLDLCPVVYAYPFVKISHDVRPTTRSTLSTFVLRIPYLADQPICRRTHRSCREHANTCIFCSLQPLCLLEIPPPLYYQYFAASFPKTPGWGWGPLVFQAEASNL